MHKARLRTFRPDQLRHLTRREGGLSSTLTVRAGDTAWDICNSHGISLAELAASNRCVRGCACVLGCGGVMVCVCWGVCWGGLVFVLCVNKLVAFGCACLATA